MSGHAEKLKVMNHLSAALFAAAGSQWLLNANSDPSLRSGCDSCAERSTAPLAYSAYLA